MDSNAFIHALTPAIGAIPQMVATVTRAITEDSHLLSTVLCDACHFALIGAYLVVSLIKLIPSLI